MSNTEETRTEFHDLMDEVRGDLVRMSGLVTEGISTVTQALLGNDIGLADQISSGDDEIDLLSVEAEEKSVVAVNFLLCISFSMIIFDLFIMRSNKITIFSHLCY